MNIASLLTRSAASHGSRIALRQGPSRLTYTELSEQASRFGSGVRALGLPRGARIALCMKNRAEYAIATWGERVAAAIVARPGCQPDANELVAHCRLHIASFKKPTRIAFLDSLPKNAYGKVLRRELRDRLISDEHGS